MRWLLLLIALLSVGATFGDVRSGETIATVESATSSGNCVEFTSDDNIVDSGAPCLATAAPVDADYLVGTANATLTNEIVAGTSPGGELGGTWASPTLDKEVYSLADLSDVDGVVYGAGRILVADGVSKFADVSMSGDVTINDGGVTSVADDSHDHATTITGKSANVSDADLGDVTISSGAWSVENDSHAHTGTTLSGIDISDDTNLVAGTNITLTDDQLDVDDAFVLNTGDTMTDDLTIDKDQDGLTALNIENDNSGTSVNHTGIVMTDGGVVTSSVAHNNNTGTLTISNVAGKIDLTPSDEVDVNGFLTLSNLSELTISSGAITATTSYHRVDTEGDAASDDLDTINGYGNGRLLVLKPMDNTHTVVVKDGTGNIFTNGDFTMDNVHDMMLLIGFTTGWYEISRSDNGA